MLAALVLFSTLATATPAEHIAKGEQLLTSLDYEAAAFELMAAATDPAATDEERLLANLLAGVAHRVAGKDLDARMNFRYVLLRAPSTTLPDDTSPKVRFFFESVRQEIAAEHASTTGTSQTAPQLPSDHRQALASTPAATSPVAAAEPSPSLSPSPPFPALAVALSAGGGLVLVAGGAAAVGAVFTLNDPTRVGADIDGTLALGRLALGAAVVGAAVGVAGGLMLALGAQ